MALLLDPDIRDWVVVPLFIIIVIAMLLRSTVMQYMQSAKQPIPVAAVRAHNLLKQATRIRGSAAQYVHNGPARQQAAVELLQQTADELEHQEKEEGGSSADPMEQMMQNPMGMLGGNMVFMVQNMVMMQGIQHFFHGFILLRVPFALTAGFKNMFQRGVADLPDLEPSFVSSVSWYFLVMYGLRSFIQLVIGTPLQEMKEQEMRLHQCGLQNPPGPGKKQDAETLAKMLRQEADNLDMLVLNKSEFDNVEKRLLGKKRYPKKKLAASNDADFLLGSKKGKGSKKKQ